MKQEFYDNIETTVSPIRLSTYKNHGGMNDNKVAIANYVLNAKIAENFYFLLQNLEVALRNAIYNGFKKHYPTSDFFYLHEINPHVKHAYKSRKEKHSIECWKMICGAKYNLRHVHNINDGKIIAELNFGFWTKLLLSTDQKYSNMWRKIFKEVFPNYPIVSSIDNDKIIIGTKIDTIRDFRNRIFHYEPIFNQANLATVHDDILTVLGWINTDLQELSRLFDEFSLIEEKKRLINEQLEPKNVPLGFFKSLFQFWKKG